MAARGKAGEGGRRDTKEAADFGVGDDGDGEVAGCLTRSGCQVVVKQMFYHKKRGCALSTCAAQTTGQARCIQTRFAGAMIIMRAPITRGYDRHTVPSRYYSFLTCKMLRNGVKARFYHYKLLVSILNWSRSMGHVTCM